MEYMQPENKKELLTFTIAWLKLEYGKWNKTGSKREIPYDLNY